MGFLQQFPGGLLGFFQLKSGASNPTKLGEELAPVLNLTEWYLQTNAENITGQSVGALGPVGTIVVPPLEYWYVHCFSVFTDPLAAGEFATLNPIIVYPISISIDVGESTSAVGTAATTIAVAHMGIPRFVPPGAQLGARVTEFAGPWNTNVQARITRMKA